MLSTIITFALGFAAGCGLREILESTKSKKSPTQNRTEIRRTNITSHTRESSFGSSEKKNVDNEVCSFNLARIEYLFDDFNVKLSDANSFSNLLRSIENTTYRQTLKLFVEKAMSPKLLYDLIENEVSKDIIIQPKSSNRAIPIPVEIIDKLIATRRLNAQSVSAVNEKVQLLISYSVTNGLKSFQDSMGNALNDFLEKFQNGEDVRSLYDEIYNNITDTYNFLTK